MQRIQEGKAAAKREGRAVARRRDPHRLPAELPGGGHPFGDLNDPKSDVAKLAKSGRAYRVLEELNIGPAVTYLAKVRNTGSGSAA